MSASSFQNALALLIRRPDDHRGEAWPEYAAAFRLTPLEMRQLQELAADPAVAKFGRIMRGGRYESLKRQVKLLGHFLPDALIKELVEEHFEPGAAQVSAHTYPADFMAFLRDDPKMRARLSDAGPPFIADLVAFEHAQLLFRRQLMDTTAPLPGPTMLRHRCFQLLALGHDIPGMLREASDGRELSDVTPVARAVKILLLGDLAVPTCRTFEIDMTVWTFLADQERASRDGIAATGPLPAQWADLVAIGLLKQPPQHNSETP